MATPTALDTLNDLARRETDEAAKRLGAALKCADEARQKLNMLLGYRDDYAARLDGAQRTGISPMAYQNFVAFMGKLDGAINGQRDIARHADYAAEAARHAWQAAERKRLSYKTLADRAADAEARRENRREQKQMDEHATRQAYYRG